MARSFAYPAARCECPELGERCRACRAWAVTHPAHYAQAVGPSRTRRRRRLLALLAPAGTWHRVTTLQRQARYPRTTIQYLLRQVVAAGVVQRRAGTRGYEYALIENADGEDRHGRV